MALHPWTSYLIVPIFALANAGIVLSADSITSPSSVLGGVALALVVGKFIGVTLFSWIAVRLGFGRLPDGARWGHVMGVGAVAGIGFTVSLFITGLAFDDITIQDDAKIGILAASIISALAGAAILAGVALPPARSRLRLIQTTELTRTPGPNTGDGSPVTRSRTVSSSRRRPCPAVTTLPTTKPMVCLLAGQVWRPAAA